jgi:hypothetical protein
MSFLAPVLSATNAFVKRASHFYHGHGSFNGERRREVILPAFAKKTCRFRLFFIIWRRSLMTFPNGLRVNDDYDDYSGSRAGSNS